MTNIVGCGPFIVAEKVNLLDANAYAMPGAALSTASAATFGRIGAQYAPAPTSGRLAVKGHRSPVSDPARMGPVVQVAEAVMQVPWCPKAPSLVETTSERHIPGGGFTSRSWRFEDSMETDEMES